MDHMLQNELGLELYMHSVRGNEYNVQNTRSQKYLSFGGFIACFTAL